MTFQEAEKTYKDLRSAHAAGKVTDADFEAQVNQLKVQDSNGRWWQLGVRTGEWYFNDGQKWVKGKPPMVATPSPAPSAPPENQPSSTPVVVPIPTPSPAVTPTPTSTLNSSPAPKEDKPERASVMPRGLFAAKPEGSNGGGMSRPVLIGIIAVVAVVVIALLVGGFLFAQSFLGGGTARATTTPTQVAIIVPTSAPTIAATATPAVTDTPAASATLVVTATNTPAVRPTNTRAAAGARTATPTKAITATATIAPPPGLYVTKITIDRTIEANQKFGFRVTFVNSTSGPAHQDKWLVVVFRKKDLVEGSPEKPFGQSPVKTLDVPVGTTELLLSEAYALGSAGEPDCHYLAEVDYVGDNNNRVPFPSTGAKPIRFEFSFCQ